MSKITKYVEVHRRPTPALTTTFLVISPSRLRYSSGCWSVMEIKFCADTWSTLTTALSATAHERASDLSGTARRCRGLP